ncbi:MAG: hypothetical protein DRP10_00135 [Candidatus Aenigmatarchaeota archaeon]|nr:MAG: hypothetical protein DRP10_00135 [Candidatus Aenigmarchaeota archaeon]
MMKKEKSKNGEKNMKTEILEFIFISVLFSLGFLVLYISNVNLNSITLLQASFIKIFTLGVQEHSAFEVFISTFSEILTAILSFIIFCFALSFLSVRKIGNLRYFLIIPIFLSGILFNFSILFLFFGFGLFVSCLYVIPLGETYKKELKKWKKFRVGSNAVSKSLFVLFLFIFLGSFISFSINDSYRQVFLNTTISSITDIVSSEISNFNTQIGNSTNEIISQVVENQMKAIREQYPNLTEEQYLQIETGIRKDIEKKMGSLKVNEVNLNLSSVISKGIENSILLNAFLVWFPIIMSFTIWVFLEFLRGLLFSPISGVFSMILFSVFGFQEE